MSHERRLQQLIKLYGAPGYVKTAADNINTDLPSHAFADQVNKQFPCHTKSAVWTSAAMLFSQAPTAVTEKIEKQLRNAAAHFDISSDVDALADKLHKASVAAETLTDDDFALVAVVDGATRRRYPLRNSHEVKTAAEYLVQHRDALLWAHKNQMAEKILTKAAAFNTAIPHHEAINQLAGNGVCTKDDIIQLAEKRATAARPTQPDGQRIRETVQAIAQTIRNSVYDIPPEGIRKMAAETFTAVDRWLGLDRLYGKSLERPEEVLFSLTQDKIASLRDGLMVNPRTGTTYSKADVDKLDTRQLREVMGNEFTSAVAPTGAFIDVEKLSTKLAHLSRNEAQLFDSVAIDAGIAPIAYTREQRPIKVAWDKLAKDFMPPAARVLV